MLPSAFCESCSIKADIDTDHDQVRKNAKWCKGKKYLNTSIPQNSNIVIEPDEAKGALVWQVQRCAGIGCHQTE